MILLICEILIINDCKERVFLYKKGKIKKTKKCAFGINVTSLWRKKRLQFFKTSIILFFE